MGSKFHSEETTFEELRVELLAVLDGRYEELTNHGIVATKQVDRLTSRAARNEVEIMQNLLRDLLFDNTK